MTEPIRLICIGCLRGFKRFSYNSVCGDCGGTVRALKDPVVEWHFEQMGLEQREALKLAAVRS